MDNLSLIDCTLREGQQSSMGHLLKNKAIAYIRCIDSIGIEYIELNNPYTSKSSLQIYESIKKLKLKARIFVHTMADRNNVNLLIKEKVKGISILFRGNNIKFLYKESDFFLKIARKNNVALRMGIENTFSIDPNIICKLIKMVQHYVSLERVSLSDTYGICTPELISKYMYLIDEKLRKNLPLELHLHNDHGLAAANFYEAYKIAKTIKRKIVVSISLAGMGERNGILSYGDVFSILYLLDSTALKKKYNISFYKDLLSLIFSNNSLFNRDPLGFNAFTHGASSHIIGVIKRGDYQAINPKDFNFKKNILISEITGAAAIKIAMRSKLKKPKL